LTGDKYGKDKGGSVKLKEKILILIVLGLLSIIPGCKNEQPEKSKTPGVAIFRQYDATGAPSGASFFCLKTCVTLNVLEKIRRHYE